MGFVKNILYLISNKNMLKCFSKQTVFPSYHLVNNCDIQHIKHLYRFKNIIQFENDLDVFKKNYKKLNPENLLNDDKIPNNSYLLSFDDGLSEIYTVIFPILKQRNIKAIFFVNPDFVDNKTMLYKHKISLIICNLAEKNFQEIELKKIAKILSFNYQSNEDFKIKMKNTKFSESYKIDEALKVLNIDIKKYLQGQMPYISQVQIQEMIDAGFYFGGHTMSHPRLNELNHEEQKKEILDSINWLKSNFKINYSMFAFPFTDKNISRKLINELIEYDKNILIFGNSGLKKDIDNRIIQRFSLEIPNKNTKKQIVTENLYKYFNKLIGKYIIKRK